MHLVIVGGGSAIAQHVIKYYIDSGNRVTAVCRSTEPRSLKDIVSGWIKVVSDIGQCEEMDVLITMTGKVVNSKLITMDMGDWLDGIESNLHSVYYALKHGLRKLAVGGNVVVVGSIVGSTGGYGCANYAAAKAGLVGLVRAAANENPQHHINLLELGYVNCGMGERLDPKVKEKVCETIPLKRFAEPQEVVEAIDFLARTKYLTGTVLPFAGGLR